MMLIVDASVAMKWVCEEEGSDRAADLLVGWKPAAPSIWIVETANALWRKTRTNELTADEATERLAALRSAPVRSMPVDDLIEPALKIAASLSHPIYDCLYLAAAIRSNVYVVTADRRFYNIVRNTPLLCDAVKLL
jgi:predicted nucleic acid-binding protein